MPERLKFSEREKKGDSHCSCHTPFCSRQWVIRDSGFLIHCMFSSSIGSFSLIMVFWRFSSEESSVVDLFLCWFPKMETHHCISQQSFLLGLGGSGLGGDPMQGLSKTIKIKAAVAEFKSKTKVQFFTTTGGNLSSPIIIPSLAVSVLLFLIVLSVTSFLWKVA